MLGRNITNRCTLLCQTVHDERLRRRSTTHSLTLSQKSLTISFDEKINHRRFITIVAITQGLSKNDISNQQQQRQRQQQQQLQKKDSLQQQQH
jgi:hypothetical protein